MKQARNLILSCLFALFASSAHAILVDFQDMADNPANPDYTGEKGFTTLSIFGMDITGWDGATQTYAYQDEHNAGLGVCGNLTSGDQCNPGDDDNVDHLDEFIRITFTRNIIVEDLFLNSNHDSPRHMIGGTVDFGGSVVSTSKTFAAGDEDFTYANGSTGDRDFLYTLDTEFEVGDTLEIAYNDVQFYLGKMTYNTPEPLSLALMGMGLIGISALRRRRRSS